MSNSNKDNLKFIGIFGAWVIIVLGICYFLGVI